MDISLHIFSSRLIMWLLSWKNVLLRKTQSFVTILITALTILSFVTIFSTYCITQKSLDLSSDRLGADVIVLPNTTDSDAFTTIFSAEPSNFYLEKRFLDDLKTINGVDKITSQFFTQTLNESCCSTGLEMRVVGFDSETDFILSPWLKSSGIDTLTSTEIFIGCDIPSFLGNKVFLLGDLFTVVGNLYPTGSGMDKTVFMTIDKARTLASNSDHLKDLWSTHSPDELISCAMIKAKPNADISKITSDINDLDLPVKSFSTSDIISNSRNQMLVIGKIIFILWLVILAISILALTGRFSALARERKCEIGLLRAIGVQKTQVFLLILLEGCILAITGGFIGSLLGCFCTIYILPILHTSLNLPISHFDFSYAVFSCVLGVISSLALGVISCLIPAWHSSSMEPQESISKGGLD